ncbi:YidH family protein [Xylanimonas protaetiae]|uniref:DUF202 domain-containing protein n=1 Tax=Xylanimonas protaetiae TaxID=2509457 RepID=A0A4P6F208_9MICO|nr:DUF202 domain-containing protein [Xylanimonas protaetiae]QAY69562.1 DUF202 domain-containing protein [Xylanimonas protaetiae]
MPDSRFPRSVYSEGTEPDPRFSLANERTFLAWIRTSLALIAAGVALEALDLPLQHALRLTASLLLLVLGSTLPVLGYREWTRAERAMRQGLPLRSSLALPVLTTGLAAAGFLLILAVLWP